MSQSEGDVETRCRIQLFGGLRAQLGEQEITHFRTQKTAALLAYLACIPPRRHPREVLIDLLWPEGGLDAGRHSLSVALSSLRQQLEPPGIPDGAVLVADRFSVGLDPAAVTTDVSEFEAALHSANAAPAAEGRREWLARAVELYQGELLPGHYDDWIPPEQHRLRTLLLQALEQLAQELEQAGQCDRALSYALRAVNTDPLHEAAHRTLMRLYAAADQPWAAIRHYDELTARLKQELDAAPSAATRALAREIARIGCEGDEPTEAGATTSGNNVSGRMEEWTSEGTGPTASILPFVHSSTLPLEPVGGAVPLASPFYVLRPADAEFRQAVARGDSIVLVKGARQVGKTSLLARELQHAREAGARVVFTDFQLLSEAHLGSAEALFRALSAWIAEQLELEVTPAQVWDDASGPALNFRRFMRREVLGRMRSGGAEEQGSRGAEEQGGSGDASPAPLPPCFPALVWGLDEVDRLFSSTFASEVFGLFRAWHNERALDPSGPWSRLTLAMAYATEAHLFISDLNQSPFNVGTRLSLEDFTFEQVADLNGRYGCPLRDAGELARFYRLVGGHPYLVRRGLHELVTRDPGGPRHGPIDVFELHADREEGIFGDHLRRMLAALARDPGLCDALRALLRGENALPAESFFRLRSAGVVSGDAADDARFRCEVYARYLRRHLAN